jgi:hypothetical protein
VHSGSAAVGKILIEDFLKNTVIMGKYWTQVLETPFFRYIFVVLFCLISYTKVAVAYF